MSDAQYPQVGKKKIVVLGAGVIGLTTAIILQEKGEYHVTIVASIFPGDERGSGYTSNWAGAHHVTLSGDDIRLQKIDKKTFEFMWKLSEPGQETGEGCFLRIKQEELYEDGYELSNSPSDFYPNLRELPTENLKTGVVRGIEFDTLTIDVPIYLSYLQARFLSKGGSFSRGTVQHIDQILEGGPYIFHRDLQQRERLAGKVPIHGLIICAGLGARTLGGVEDHDVYPTRGQIVVIRAPWVRTGRSLTGEHWVYIIPRRSGDVVVGGVREVDDWFPLPRLETRMDILRRGLELYPELAPPEVREKRKPVVDDLLPLIVEDGCGLRPSRKGGIRLEAKKVQVKGGRTVPLIYNYGHGGHGFISSWGSAFSVLGMLADELRE